MSKQAEIDYVVKMAHVLQVGDEEVERSLLLKPFNIPRRGAYLMDIAQIFRILPEPPQRLLDLGCGPGWTSRLFAMAGYDVTGLDLSPDMIRLARQASGADDSKLCFLVHDYEESLDFGSFDIALIYDALHHAIAPGAVIQNVYHALNDGGVLITAEPGAGHSRTDSSIQAVERFGTTEEDMPFSKQRSLMMEAGFREVRQYLRLSELPLANVGKSSREQAAHYSALAHNTEFEGFTCIIEALK
jgi:SAM-dependent methyltransferase